MKKMAKATRDQISIDGFEGLNELLSPFDLGAAAQGREARNWLVTANNVDIDDGKTVKRRPGTTKIASFTDPHSLWSNGERTLFAESGNLRRVDDISSSSLSSTVLLSGAGNTRFSYAKAHDKIYFSNEKKNGMILSNGKYHGWGVETPTGQPTLSTTTGAINIDCSISVFVTYIDDLGRESGASGIATLEVTAETGVLLSNIPVPTSSEVSFKAIYATPPDGDVFYMMNVIDTGVTSHAITNFNHRTVKQNTLFLSEPPLGSLLASEGGRVWVANDEYLYYSEPLIYHLFKLRENYYQFSEKISIIAAVDGGLFVAADKTYFISTAEETPALNEVLGYGAVPNSTFTVDGEKIGEGQGSVWVGWIGKKGIVIGGPGGQVRNITEDRTAIGTAVEGASMVREDDGYTRVISTFKPGGESAGLRTTDYVEATVVKCPAQSTTNSADNYYYTADTTTITADAA